MQGYIILEGTDATKVMCSDCAKAHWRFDELETSFLGEMMNFEVDCGECDVTIDGEPVAPKPHSWTITVEVVVYHSEDEDLYTVHDAKDRVQSALYDEFGDVRVVDSAEHFEQ